MSNSSSDNKGSPPKIAPPGSARGAGTGRPVIAPPGSAGKKHSGGGAADWSVLRRQHDQRSPGRDEPQAPKATARRPAPAPIDNRTRRAKNLSDQVAGGSTSAAIPSKTSIRSAISVVLITRNHEALVCQRLQQLRECITAMDTRWWALDLGSVDRSVAVAREARVNVIFAPGGRVHPMASLDQALTGCGGEVIVLLDAECLPGEGLHQLIESVRQGPPLAVPRARSPGVVVVRRSAWEGRRFEGDHDLVQWANACGGLRRFAMEGSSVRRAGNLLPLTVGSGPIRSMGRFMSRLRQVFSSPS